MGELKQGVSCRRNHGKELKKECQADGSMEELKLGLPGSVKQMEAWEGTEGVSSRGSMEEIKQTVSSRLCQADGSMEELGQRVSSRGSMGELKQGVSSRGKHRARGTKTGTV